MKFTQFFVFLLTGHKNNDVLIGLLPTLIESAAFKET